MLADTGPLYALVDRNDQHHARAHRELERLAQERLTLAVATCTLIEAQRLILFRLGFRVAKRWMDQITYGASLVNPTTEDVLEAADRIHRYPDQDITLHDGVLAILSQKLQHQVWAFDRHFTVMQVAVWR